jgi:hypothetical protein
MLCAMHAWRITFRPAATDRVDIAETHTFFISSAVPLPSNYQCRQAVTR